MLGLPGTLNGPLVAGDIVHQDDEAADQLVGAVFQGAKTDVEAAPARVRIQPDGVQFVPACGQDVVEHGLQRVAVVLQCQPVAQRARFGQTQEGLQCSVVGMLQPAFFGRDEDRAAEAFQDVEILIPLAGQTPDVLGQGRFAGRAHGPWRKHGLGRFIEEVVQDSQQGVGIWALRDLLQVLAIGLAAQGEQAMVQLQGHAGFVMAPGDLA